MDFFVFVQLLLPGLTTGCVYALVALGFVLCANVSGVVNFAQGEYVMLGGVIAAFVSTHGVPLPLAIAIAVATGALLGALQERLTLAPARHSPDFIQITITLGVAVVLRGVALIAFGKDPLSMPGFSGDGVTCVDINECNDPTFSSMCSVNATCNNTFGSWNCSCNTGYRGTGFDQQLLRDLRTSQLDTEPQSAQPEVTV